MLHKHPRLFFPFRRRGQTTLRRILPTTITPRPLLLHQARPDQRRLIPRLKVLVVANAAGICLDLGMGGYVRRGAVIGEGHEGGFSSEG